MAKTALMQPIETVGYASETACAVGKRFTAFPQNLPDFGSRALYMVLPER